MDAVTDITTVERELEIDASPETVWEFLVDPEKAIRWMGMTATLDVRPGGEYRVEVIPGNTAVGEFVEVDPPHRLVQTWGWDPSGRGEVEPGVDADRVRADRERRHHDPALQARAADGEGRGVARARVGSLLRAARRRSIGRRRGSRSVDREPDVVTFQQMFDARSAR